MLQLKLKVCHIYVYICIFLSQNIFYFKTIDIYFNVLSITYNITIWICVDFFSFFFLLPSNVSSLTKCSVVATASLFVVFVENCASRYRRRVNERQRGGSLRCKRACAARPISTAGRYEKTKADAETSYKTFFFFLTLHKMECKTEVFCCQTRKKKAQ